MSKRTVILVVLDGWGIGRADESNAIHVVNPQNINYLKANFPAGVLQASGISVGLPWSEEGNSEVGHLNLGAGRIIYQYYPRITLAIREGDFFNNQALKAAFEHAKKNNSAVNLVGLLSGGNVHSSLEHLLALIEFAKKEKVDKLNFHLFTDGRDSPPESAMDLLAKLPKETKLASLSGRFYGMDREGHWDRTQKAYAVLVGEGPTTENIEDHLKKAYGRKLTDEFVEPVLIGPENRGIKDNDAVIFFNFREDRIRQITAAFVDKQFKNFPVKSFSNLYVATMTKYDDSFKVPVAFQPEKIEVCLAKVLQDNGKSQVRIAETQKYPHITYFFNGMREEPFKNEYRILVPSRTIVRQEEQPQMMAAEITTRALESIAENVFDFILINYANPDIIAHTGNYEACLQAVRVVDEQIGKLIKVVLEYNAILIVTSDHGNIERIFNPLTGVAETQHDPSPVPIYLVAKEFQRQKTQEEIIQSEKINTGILADVAPTILELMGIPKPKEMTGQSLLKSLISS
jgi:2,3-bisphosphoglycerate-independent phosphoglycerate mutase